MNPGAVRTEYDQASSLFRHGYLERSQQLAERGYERYKASNPTEAGDFQLLAAESMLFRGMYSDALRLVESYDQPGILRKLAIEAVASTREQQVDRAHRALAVADARCAAIDDRACGEILRAHGILAGQENDLPGARQFFLKTTQFAQAHQDRWLEASSSINLGWVALHTGHFDEAVDLSRRAYRDARALGAEDLAQSAAGNLGWAYYQLGDDERALDQFIAAQSTAARLGDTHTELLWIDTAGYVYRDAGELNRAADAYQEALAIARSIGSKDDIVNALEDLAQVSVDAGKLDEAATYISQVTPIELANGGRLHANLRLTEGMLAAARSQNSEAETLLRAVAQDPSNLVTLRLGAGGELARLFEAEGNPQAAEKMYGTTLDAFDAAWAELKSEESQLPFVANATHLYDGYIHLLLEERRTDEALAIADQSRARTLAHSLDPTAKASARLANLNSVGIANKVGATLLFYWLGKKGSCLWAITPSGSRYFPLPPQAEIIARVNRYSKSVIEGDPLANNDEDGQALYRILVAPAEELIKANPSVLILDDGALSRLNFETLLAPGPSPARPEGTHQVEAVSAIPLHYWIEDATVVSAPSLAMLAASGPAPLTAHSLLLLGNPISASEDFPTLPLFAFESSKIQTHFDPRNVVAFTSAQATPAAYLTANPAHYSYIHFVSHAVSSRTDPLDSAIILSPAAVTGSAPAAGDSYKLYARDIMRHRIDAQLVTISACNGVGTRSYAGEGMVGLSWAFLRAGAHSVIGSLWEASDDSSPRIMDALYQGIEQGRSPAAALRNAKLALLESGGKFQAPFYWAPFQIYSSGKAALAGDAAFQARLK
jgi:CHAT domain-containing protein